MASSRSNARMHAVASNPSMIGIIISIKTASNSPSSEALNSLTQRSPFSTKTTVAPADSNINLVTSIFNSLSSATRIFLPVNTPDTSSSGCSSSKTASWFTTRGILISNTDPFPCLLVNEICPFILSNIFLTIGSPKPVPPYKVRAVSDSCANGSKIFC